MKQSIHSRLYGRSEQAESGCILWKGGTGHYGYGLLKVGGVSKRAHRLSYELYWGAIPADKWILHTCDVTRCINPFHLIPGSPSDNAKDRCDKERSAPCALLGRNWTGENNGNSKLSNEETRQIITSKESGRVLAERYGVTASRISGIRAAAGTGPGKYWRKGKKGG